MTEYRGLSGTYSDFKLVKTRSVCQAVIEFPIEEAEQVIESLGIPVPGKERHVCIGLRDKLLEIAEGKATGPERHANLSLVGKQRYAEADEMKRAVMRAGMLPNDPQFIDWVSRKSELSAVDFIRNECDVESRSEIATDENAFHAFMRMEREFLVWAGRAAELRA
jgi:hypothetical protein